MTKCYAIINMPGYLPDSDPFECDTIKEGKACLLESLESHADSIYDPLEHTESAFDKEIEQAKKNIQKHGYAVFRGYAYSIQKF